MSVFVFTADDFHSKVKFDNVTSLNNFVIYGFRCASCEKLSLTYCSLADFPSPYIFLQDLEANYLALLWQM